MNAPQELRAVAVLPVVPTDDPWRELDVLALRVHDVPLVEQLVSRLEAAGTTVVVAVAGDVTIRAGRARVVHSRPDARYGGALHAAMDVMPSDVDVVVVHDCLSALTPPSLIRRLVAEVQEASRPAVLTREVFETVKTMKGGDVGETVPRDLLESVHAPLAMPAGQFEQLRKETVAELSSFFALHEVVRGLGPVTRVHGSVLSQAFVDRGSLSLMECAEETLAPDPAV